MSTTPSTLPGQEVTGREGVDNAAALEASINARLDSIQKQLSTQPGYQNPAGVNQDQNQTPGPVKFTIHGKDFQFANQEEASRAIEEALMQTREMTAQELAAVNQSQSQQQSNTQNAPVFDRKRFAELVDQDPSRGIEYAMSQIIFGQDVPNAGAVIRQQLAEVNRLKQLNAVSTFRSTVPDFRGTPEEIQATERMRQEMNLPTDNPMAWEAAYAMAKHRGMIPQQQQQQTQQTQQQSGPVVPPMFDRSAAAPAAAWVQRAENLPTDQLEAFINDIQNGRIR